MLEITVSQRRALRSRAHGIKPVVSIGQNGLSDTVIKEIEVGLNSHELIKVRVYNDDREERERLIAEICERTGAAPVQHIGKLLVIWRPETENEKTDKAYDPRRKSAGIKGRTPPFPDKDRQGGKTRVQRRKLSALPPEKTL